MRRALFLSALFLPIAGITHAQAPLLPAPSAERCAKAPASRSAKEWLDLAAARVLPPIGDSTKLYRYSAGDNTVDWIESDRPYEPFIPEPAASVRWVDLQAGTEWQTPGGGLATDPSRRMNPWLVLHDWQADAADAHVIERCVYRDYPRVVLERKGERLFLSEVDATPVKLERIEPSTTWGQNRAEYLWATWWGVRGGGLYPVTSYRILDGVTYTSRRVIRNVVDIVPRDSAPAIVTRPAPPPGAGGANAPVDTVRVNDHTFQLVAPFYTETVTLQKDTVFILDATTSEDRARQDSTWIAQLFPGRHPVTVVVTDLAWPHVGGVRFWVANGATIVSHKLSSDFLTRLVSRKWTLQPDLLEKKRATSRFRFRPVTDSISLAGGAVMVHAMRGGTTEGALAVFLPKDQFLWAGDYIQRDAASPYVRDVIATVHALKLQPVTVGAEHIRLTPWSAIDRRP